MTTLISFLGVLLDGVNKIISIPEEKRIRALRQINWLLDKKSAKVKELQQLAGLLNFLNRAIVPGRVFTRRMYAKFSKFATIGRQGKFRVESILKQHHHVKLDREFKDDCRMWVQFLESNPDTAGETSTYTTCRPFVDLAVT